MSMILWLVIWLSAICPVLADPIVYAVDVPLNIDAGYGTGAVTGTITTDGTIGLLAAGNIDDFDLSVRFGGYSATLTAGNAGRVFFGPVLTATSGALLFNFSGGYDGTAGGVAAFSRGAGTDYYAGWQTGGMGPYPANLFVAELGYVDVGTNRYANAAWGSYCAEPCAPMGWVEVATAVAPVAVPGPLLGGGLPGLVAGLGLLLWWRRQA